jgi:hypothetical protein
VEGQEDPPPYSPPQKAGDNGRDAYTHEGPYEQLVKVAGTLIVGAEEVLALSVQSGGELYAAGSP